MLAAMEAPMDYGGTTSGGSMTAEAATHPFICVRGLHVGPCRAPDVPLSSDHDGPTPA